MGAALDINRLDGKSKLQWRVLPNENSEIFGDEI